MPRQRGQCAVLARLVSRAIERGFLPSTWVLFTQPAPTAEMLEILHWKIGTAELNRQIRITAGSFNAHQVLKLNGRLRVVVNQHHGGRVVGTMVNGENELLWRC
jgi:hypothetical protein